MSVDSCLSRRGRSSLGSVKSGTNGLPRHKIVHECLYVIRSSILLKYKEKNYNNPQKKKLKKEPLCYNITLPESLDSKHAVPCSKLKIKERNQ